MMGTYAVCEVDETDKPIRLVKRRPGPGAQTLAVCATVYDANLIQVSVTARFTPRKFKVFPVSEVIHLLI